MAAEVTNGSTFANVLEPKLQEFDHRTSPEVKQFVKFAQCQFPIETVSDINDLSVAKDPSGLAQDVRRCLSLAVSEGVDVLILPELALQLPRAERENLLNELKAAARDDEIIIIGGSFYDDNRHACVPIIGPGWLEIGQKLKPSRYESSTVSGKGMVPGSAVPVIHTDYGSFVILTCADLISDQAQYVARRLATQRRVQCIVNNCWNPSALEFLIECNSIARRHPVFVQVTNVSSPTDGFGHTALLYNLGERPYSPASQRDLLDMVPLDLVQRDESGKRIKRLLAFDCVAADVGIAKRAMLTYELNMLLSTIPAATNAPDQGYPPIRDLKILPLNGDTH